MNRHAIGIDLGTTNSCVAVLDEGRPRVLGDAYERLTMPSVLAETEDGSIVVGHEAVRCVRPRRRYAFVKRMMGKHNRFPVGGEPRSAAWISARYLEALKARAEAHLGGPVAAVITVPAHFETVHREHTREAARLAGLEVLELICEPVAAALTWFDRQGATGEVESHGKVLVYDLGGGTVDVSLCTRTGNHIQVGADGRAYEGDQYLGGFDFDRALARQVFDQIQAQGQVPVETDLVESIGRTPWLWQLLTDVEYVKKALSREPVAAFDTRLRIGERQISVQRTFKRVDFERAIEPLVGQTLAHCRAALERHARAKSPAMGPEALAAAVKREAQAVDVVLLVGGSTKVPYVSASLRRYFHDELGATVPVQSFEPDLCVAMGAALYAETLLQRSPDETFGDGSVEIEWDRPPETQESAPTHDRLTGRVVGLGRGGSIHLVVNDEAREARLQDRGRFTLEEFPLEPGSNTLRVEVRDAAGVVRVAQRHTVRRGGLSAAGEGLSRDITVQLVDERHTLLPTGTRPGVVQSHRFYTVDESGSIRLPIFEGLHPHDAIEVEVRIPSHSEVEVRASYQGGRLEIDLHAGGERVEREVSLTTRRVDGELEALRRRFGELGDAIDQCMAALPENARASIEDRVRMLRFDIRIELESPMLDISRLTSKLRELESIRSGLRYWEESALGLELRLTALRKRLLDDGETRLIERVDRILARLEGDVSGPRLIELKGEYEDVWRDVKAAGACEPITMDEVTHLRAQIEARLGEVRGVGVDPDEQSRINEIAGVLESLRGSDQRAEAQFWVLWKLERNFLNPLYIRTVEAHRRRGLLTTQRA